MSAKTFAYKPLPAGHIRLLCRNSNSPSSSVVLSSDEEDHYQLVTFSSKDSPAYEVISYCWGTEPSNQQRFLNMHMEGGGALPITPHLKEGLRSAFAVFDSKWLWVGAICITQDDEVEKAEQVAQMARIFEDARRVVVWLGADYDDSKRVMELMPLLSSQKVLEMLSMSPRIDWGELQMLGVPDCHDGFWISVFDLLHRPWFERLWIVQEAFLAREAVFLCGRCTVSWDRLRGLCAALGDGDLIRELGEHSLAWRAERTKYRSFRAR